MDKKETVMVGYHGLPKYLRKLATRKAVQSLPGISVGDLMKGHVLFELSCPGDTSAQHRELLGMTYLDKEEQTNTNDHEQ